MFRLKSEVRNPASSKPYNPNAGCVLNSRRLPQASKALQLRRVRSGDPESEAEGHLVLSAHEIMSKRQLICPLAALALAGLVLAALIARSHYRYYIHAQARRIGQDLVSSTNSMRLTEGLPEPQFH